MNRREFFGAAGAILAADGAHAADEPLPKYRVVTPYQREGKGMPGPYPAQVVSVHSSKVIEEAAEKVDAEVVREMIGRGMSALTGDAQSRDSWARFFTASDVVGIKVNASGAPGIFSSREVVVEIARNLLALGIPPANVFVYERFRSQLDDIGYEKALPKGIQVEAAEERRGSRNERYDPDTYVEVDFFGEDDTRSNICKVVTKRATKIVNVPNMKDHGASGVTGCLKNIAYGSFSNVARSHSGVKTNTYSLIGTLAAVEPLRSRAVLSIMDGIRGVWHGGPFSPGRRFRFYPKQILVGTDPVAMDRLLLDIIDGKRKAEGANSVWERSRKFIRPGQGYDNDPNYHRFIREPGHIEYAAKLGLGEYQIGKIQVKKVELG
jgi:uncharacterized protein (DUF362 family)